MLNYHNWNKGNVPEDKNIWYWLTMKTCTTTEVYYLPCQYSEKSNCWVNAKGEHISMHTVIAYYPIAKPQPYNYIGVGFYIRTTICNNESIYGYGLQFANWCGRGYSTKEKAIAALKRLKKIDEKEDYVKEIYEVIDGYHNVIWKLS